MLHPPSIYNMYDRVTGREEVWDVVSMQWHQSLWRWRLVYHSPIRRLLSVALAATRGGVEDIIKWENGRNITNMIDAAAPLLTTIMKGLGSLKNCWDSDLMVNIIYISWFIRRPGPEMNVDADPKTCQRWNMKWAKLGWWSRVDVDSRAGNEGSHKGSQSRKRFLLGPSPVWKLLPLSYLRHYTK